MGSKPRGDRIKVALKKGHIRRGRYGAEDKDVVSIESELRGDLERDVSYTIDVDEKKEGTKNRTLRDS